MQGKMIYHQKTGNLYHALLSRKFIEFISFLFLNKSRFVGKNKSLKFAKLIRFTQKNACRHILNVFQQRQKKMQILLDSVQK